MMRSTFQPNVQLLRHTLGHIHTRPHEWVQGMWRTDCGTAGCYAFWTVSLSGGAFTHDDREYVRLDSLPAAAGELLREHLSADGRTAHIQDAAAALLGLVDVCPDDGGVLHADMSAANRLFKASNSLEELERIVGELCAAAPAGGA